MGSYAEATSGAGSTQEYPTPLLTVGAELDGGLGRPAMIGVRLKGSDGAAANHSAGNSTVFQLTKKPVVILPGLDHSSFCPGFQVATNAPPPSSSLLLLLSAPPLPTFLPPSHPPRAFLLHILLSAPPLPSSYFSASLPPSQSIPMSSRSDKALPRCRFIVWTAIQLLLIRQLHRHG